MKNNNKAESAGGGFISGVFILSLSTLIVKIIGLAFKIPMLSLLGMEGMGYFNSAYEIYAVLCVVSTAGLPIALSILISSERATEDSDKIVKIYRTAIKIFFALGAIGTLFMAVLAAPLSRWIGNDDAVYCIIAIAPALFFICLASAIRGYCQGFEDMKPTAISQLIEAISKLALGVSFAMIGIKKGFSVPMVAALAVLGITVGTALSLLYLLIAKRKHTVSQCNSAAKENKKCYGELFKIALPITLGSAVISLTRIIDMALIMRRLQDVGVSQFRANEIYGAYTTLALPVFSLIPSLITPIAMALIPELTVFIKRKNLFGQKETVEKAIRLTSLLAMPSSLAVSVFSRQILSLLFASQTEAVEIAAPLLSLLGGSVLFSCLITTANAILQAYGCVKMPIFSMSVGVLVKAFTSYFLLGAENIGAYGAPIGSLACNVTVVLLNFALILRYASGANDSLNFSRCFVKPFLSSVLAIGLSYVAYGYLSHKSFSNLVAFAVAVAIAIPIYFLLAFLLGALSRDDIKMMPILKKLIKE